MSHNPFSPPHAELEPAHDRSQRPFHLVALALGLAAWGLYRVMAATAALAGIGTAGMPLWVYYLALLPGLVCLCAAYVLWQRSVWFTALVAVVPPLSVALYAATAPATLTLASSYFGQMVERLPPWQLLQGLAAVAAVVYGGFLRKWGWLR